MDNEVVILKTELEQLIVRTTKLEFPFFATDKKKKEILLREKLYINTEIDRIADKYQITTSRINSDRETAWHDAIAIVEKKFQTLPLSLRINSFFLQELMHEYAENQAKWIKSSSNI